MNSFKRTPKKKIDPEKAEEFIKGANKTQSEKIIVPPDRSDSIIDESDKESPEDMKEQMPWENANDRIKKHYNLTFVESQYLKIKYIQSKTNLSIQKIVMAALDPYIENQIKELQKK